MLDVVLISIAGVFQLIVTAYAVDISVRENRKRNAVVIGVIGLVAILLTAWAAYDTVTAQEKLNNEVAAIKKQLSGATVGLVKIGLQPSVQQLTPEKDILMGMAIGVTEGTAKKMRCNFVAFTLPGPENTDQNRVAISRFREQIAKEDQATGEDRLVGTGCFKGLLVRLNESEIAEVVAGNRIMYMMGHAEWNNESGADFHTDFYKWMEPPKTRVLDNPGWHDCAR